MLLKIDHISAQYDGLEAISSVSLEISPAGFVCILGPNGAGKSTLLRHHRRCGQTVSGEILFEGNRISGLPPHQVAALGISLVPEEGWLYPQMSVEENLLMGAYPGTVRRNGASAWMRFSIFFRG